MLKQFWTWIQSNPNVVAAMANVLLFATWLVYLELFYRQHRRARRPYLEIQHGQGSRPSSVCLLVNMGQELVDVKCVVVSVKGDGHHATYQVSDYRRITSQDRDIPQILRQGPLRSGNLIVIGHFKDLVRGAGLQEDGRTEEEQQSNIPVQDVKNIEIRCVALHGSSSRLVGARRVFSLEHSGEQTTIRPETIETVQLRTRRDQRRLRKWVHDASCEISCMPDGSEEAGDER